MQHLRTSPASGSRGDRPIAGRWCVGEGGHEVAGTGATSCWRDPSEVASTSALAGAGDGRMRDADIQLNSAHFRWGDPDGHPAEQRRQPRVHLRSHRPHG